MKECINCIYSRGIGSDVWCDKGYSTTYMQETKCKHYTDDTPIHVEQYKKIKGIIRGELAHFTCYDCKRNDAEHYPCECAMMYDNIKFKPTDRYVSAIADKIMEVAMEEKERDR